MDSFKVKLIFALIAFGLIAGGVVGALLYYVFPQYYPNWYFGIIFFFIITESIMMYYVASQIKNVSSKKMVNVYMMAKVVKIILALIFVTVYALAVKENLKNFVLIFLVFYVLYLFVETFLFSRIEKHFKEKK
ncbi:MAG: hypothetical protein ACLVKO_10330 [Dysgonomonas sp.]